MVGVQGLEPWASCSQSRRATNCATPRSLTIYTYGYSLCYYAYFTTIFIKVKRTGSKERKRDSAVKEKGAIAILLPTEATVSMGKDCEDCLKVLQLSWEAPAPP